MKDLDSILQDASFFIKSEFNLQLQKSKLKIYPPDVWKEFCKVNGFDVNSEGLYVPISYTAYVRTDSPVLVSNIFHELYGHGLFVEHSRIGKKLIEILKQGGNKNGFLFKDIDYQEQTFGIFRTNIDNYEGFAVWLEALLCKETGNSRIWKLKKKGLSKDYIALLEYLQEIEQEFTRFFLISQLGFPKFYDKNKILNLIKKFYGSHFNNIEFIVLYGSQKPESDIDLFIVSDNFSNNYFNGWLDIYELNKEVFYNALKHFDISVTDPIFTGNLIYGDKNKFEQLKLQVLEQPITPEDIEYNFIEAIKQRELLPEIPENDKRRKDCLSYIESFLQNAKQLSLGHKALTLKELKKRYKVVPHIKTESVGL